MLLYQGVSSPRDVLARDVAAFVRAYHLLRQGYIPEVVDGLVEGTDGN